MVVVVVDSATRPLADPDPLLPQPAARRPRLRTAAPSRRARRCAPIIVFPFASTSRRGPYPPPRRHPGFGPATNHRVPMPSDDIRDASDAILVVGIGRYRQEALAEACRRHAGAVFALARRLLVDRAMAAEVVQAVVLRLWHSPEKFDPDRGSLRSFLL